MTEEINDEVIDVFLGDKAKRFGLSPKFINELPMPAKKLLYSLESLGTAVYEGERVSMLDEAMLSGAILQNNPDVIKKALGPENEEQLLLMQRDLIRGTLLSDLGKAANPEISWLYRVNIPFELAKAKLPEFLEKRYEKPTQIDLMDLPYSVALDFYNEIRDKSNDLTPNAWEEERSATDNKLKELGFKINPATEGTKESSFHEVMTGAHLVELPDIIKKCGIDDNPDWERAIFIAKNHHLSRGLYNGLPLPDNAILGYLSTIFKNNELNQNELMQMALFEELLDSTIAAFYRHPRQGDDRGTNARLRLMDNLNKSVAEGRMDILERNYIEAVAESLFVGGNLSDSVVKLVMGLKKKE